MISKKKMADTVTSVTAQRVMLATVSFLITEVLFNHFFISNLFGGMLIFSALIFGCVLALLLFTLRNLPDIRSTGILTFLSAAMSLSIIVGSRINTYELIPITFEFRDVFHLLAWFILIFCVSNFLVILLERVSSNANLNVRLLRKVWPRASLLMLASWTPYLLAFFPGLLSSDTSDQLSQALGDSPLNNHHPVLIAGFMSPAVHLGLLLTDSFYVAIALATITQMVIVAGVLGYIVSWVTSRFTNPLLGRFTLIFFAIFPLVPFFAISIGKDTYFAVSMLLLTTCLYDMVITKGELFRKKSWIVYFIVVMLLVIFTRNNGVYIILLSALALLSVFYRYWKQALPVFAFVAIFTALVQGPVYAAFRVPLSSSTESFGVLLQQVGRTIALDGDLSLEEKRTLAPILPLDKWAKHYSPSTPDRLKFCYTEMDGCMNNKHLDLHKVDFLKTWLSIGLKNPRTYVEAFLIQNSNFWRIGSTDDYGSFTSDEKRYTAGSIDLFESTFRLKLSSFIQNIIYSLRHSAIGLVMNQGFLIWIVAFAGLILILNKQYSTLVTLVPMTGLWLSLMLAAPAMSFRYSLAIFLALPILLALIVTYSESKEPARS